MLARLKWHRVIGEGAELDLSIIIPFDKSIEFGSIDRSISSSLPMAPFSLKYSILVPDRAHIVEKYGAYTGAISTSYEQYKL